MEVVLQVVNNKKVMAKTPREANLHENWCVRKGLKSFFMLLLLSHYISLFYGATFPFNEDHFEHIGEFVFLFFATPHACVGRKSTTTQNPTPEKTKLWELWVVPTSTANAALFKHADIPAHYTLTAQLPTLSKFLMEDGNTFKQGHKTWCWQSERIWDTWCKLILAVSG